MKIPFNNLLPMILPLENEISKEITSVIKSGIYLKGINTDCLEEEWANYCGQKYCVFCSSGTDAITIAAKAMELKTVEIPANTVWYTAKGFSEANCLIKPVDIKSNGQIEKITTNSIPVPLYGNFPNKKELNCKMFDAAQAHGWKPPEHAVVAWSFYPTKNLGSLGDAGAVTTNDLNLAKQIKILTSRDENYKSTNQIISRISEIQAAILRIRLKYLNENIKLRKKAAQIYLKYLPSNTKLANTKDSNFHLFVIFANKRSDLQKYLFSNGIETKCHYPIPIHQYADWKQNQPIPNAEKWCDTVLSLPFYPGIKTDDIQYVSDYISRFYTKC